MRRPLFSLAIAALATFTASAPSWAQAAPNQPDVGAVIQQFQQNMNNAGMTPQDLIQQARDQAQQNGGQFDGQAFMQNLQQQGIINQNMLDQVSQMRNQFQQSAQQRQMASLQQLLNSPDDEWAVLGTKIQRVLDLSNDFNQATAPAPRGRGRGANTAAPGPVAKALIDLQTLLRDPTSSDTEIHARLTAYRDARQHVAADLAHARQDVLTLVTLRQEAILLVMQVLD